MPKDKNKHSETFSSEHPVADPPRQRLPLGGADVWYLPDFLSAAEDLALFEELHHGATWSPDARVSDDGEVALERLAAWYGQPGATGATRAQPLPLTATLETLRRRVEAAAEARFNAVLLTLYRHGDDNIGWHRDDFAVTGERPVLAVVSLGAARDFEFRPRAGHDGEPFSIALAPGSLLVMAGATQEHWEHRLCQADGPVGERICLTFHWVIA